MSYPQLEITYEKPPRDLVLLKEINTYTLTGFTRIKTPHLMNQQSVLRTLVGWKKEVQWDSWKLAPAHLMRSSYEGQAETCCWKVGGGSPGLPGSSLGSSFPNKVTERDTNALVECWNFRCSLQNPARCGAIKVPPIFKPMCSTPGHTRLSLIKKADAQSFVRANHAGFLYYCDGRLNVSTWLGYWVSNIWLNIILGVSLRTS